MPQTIRPDVSIAQMRSLVEVVAQSSFSRAAENLLLSRPAVWQQIRRLESQYGIRLIGRQGRVAVATEQGVRLANIFSETLARIDSIPEVMRQESGTKPSVVRLRCGFRSFFDEVGDAIERFHSRHPEVVLQILNVPTGNALAEAIVSKKVDLAITATPERIEGDWLQVELRPAYALDTLLVMPLNHPLADKKRIRLEDIVRYPLILWPRGIQARDRVEAVLAARGLAEKVSIVAESGDTIFTVEMVRRGLGLGITAGHDRRTDSTLTRDVKTYRLSNWFGIQTFQFGWRRGTLPPPLVLELVEMIRAAAKGTPVRGNIPGGLHGNADE